MANTRRRPPQNAQAALDAGLDLVRGFLADRDPENSDSAQTVSRLGDGDSRVDLDRPSALEFHRIRDAFERFVELQRTLTLRTVHRVVERAIVKHFESGDVNATIAALRSELSAEPRTFTVYVPIVGLSPDSVPGEFGGVPIVSLEQGRADLLEGKSPEGQVLLDALVRGWPWRPPPNRGALLVMEVEGTETAAACDIALEQARMLADVLHFFTDGQRLTDQGVAIADSRGWATQTGIVIASDSQAGEVGSINVQTGTGPGFFLNHHNHDPMWQPVSRILAKSDRSRIESLILTSVAWAGRATKEPRRDLAFGQFAIALEALVIPTRATEITERLALRVARLLAPKLREQPVRDIYQQVKDYYQIRSNIVHDGTTFISNVDLFGFHMLTKWVIRRVTRICKEQGFSTLEELNEWLVQLLLGAVEVPEPTH